MNLETVWGRGSGARGLCPSAFRGWSPARRRGTCTCLSPPPSAGQTARCGSCGSNYVLNKVVNKYCLEAYARLGEGRVRKSPPPRAIRVKSDTPGGGGRPRAASQLAHLPGASFLAQHLRKQPLSFTPPHLRPSPFSFPTPTGRFSRSPLTYPSRCPYQQPVAHCGKWPSPRLDSCSYGRKQAATMARKFPYVLYSHKELSPVSLWPGRPGPGPETT